MRRGSAASRFGVLVAALVLLAAPAYFLQSALLDPQRVLIAADTMGSHPPWQADFPSPQNPELSDHAQSWIPWSSFLSDEVVHRGRAPLWNPYQFCGSPALGNPQFGHFDPFGMPLHAAFGSFGSALDAFEWGAYLRLVLAGLGAYLLARRLGRSRAAALLAGAIYAYGGFHVLWLLYPLAHVACFLPWVLWAVDRAQREAPRSGALLTALFLALAVLAGHPETAFFVGCAGGLYAVHGGIARFRAGAGLRPLGTALLALGAGTLLGAPALLPFVEYLGESAIDAVRAQRESEDGTGPPALVLALRLAALGALVWIAAREPSRGSLAVRALAGAVAGAALALLFCGSDAALYPQLLLDPAWLGDPRTGDWRGPATYLESYTAYVGAGALALAAIAWTSAPRGGTRARGLLAALALIALLAGRGIAPFDALLHAIPPFSFVELTRAHLVANLALALLASLGLDGLLDVAHSRDRSARSRALLAPAATLLCTALGCFFASPDQERGLARETRATSAAGHEGAVSESILEPRGTARLGIGGLRIRVRTELDAATTARARFERVDRSAPAIERALSPSSEDRGVLQTQLFHQELPNGAYDLVVRCEDARGVRELRGGRILWGLQGGPLTVHGWSALCAAALGVLILGCSALGGWAARARWRNSLAGVAIAGCAFELWCFGATWNPACLSEPIYRATPSLEFLRDRLREARARGDGEFRIWAATSVLPPSAATGLRLRDVRGYDAIESSRWQLVQQALLLHPAFRTPWIEMPASAAQLGVANFPVEAPLFLAMGVRYVLDDVKLAPEVLAARGLRIAFPAASDTPPRDGVYVYEAAGADGRRAFLCREALSSAEGAARIAAGDFALARDPRGTLLLDALAPPPPLSPPARGGTVRFEVDDPDRVVLRIEGLDGEAWLALMDSTFPGWEAEVDGAAVPIEIAHHAFRAVRLPAGAQRVELVYRPRSFRNGLWVAAAGIALVLCSVWLARRQSPLASPRDLSI